MLQIKCKKCGKLCVDDYVQAVRKPAGNTIGWWCTSCWKAPADAPCPTCAAIVESWDEHDDHWEEKAVPTKQTERSCNNCRYEPSNHIFPVCEKCDPETYSNWKPAAIPCPQCNGNGMIYPNGDKYIKHEGE